MKIKFSTNNGTLPKKYIKIGRIFKGSTENWKLGEISPENFRGKNKNSIRPFFNKLKVFKHSNQYCFIILKHVRRTWLPDTKCFYSCLFISSSNCRNVPASYWQTNFLEWVMFRLCLVWRIPRLCCNLFRRLIPLR